MLNIALTLLKRKNSHVTSTLYMYMLCGLSSVKFHLKSVVRVTATMDQRKKCPYTQVVYYLNEHRSIR
uniref:Uncharacterized protein n=1 Tax=Romanomermis culicivorax TaxID=13658 RepID=A0A915IXA4_ROMCU